MTEIKAESKEMTLEEFKELARKVLPHLKAIGIALSETNVNPDELASIAVSGDGYLTFGMHHSDWNLLKMRESATAVVRREYSEALDL